jgi:hypothetical protein
MQVKNATAKIAQLEEQQQQQQQQQQQREVAV